MRFLHIYFLVIAFVWQVGPCVGMLEAAESSVELDSISLACLECHDGSSGPHAIYCLLKDKYKGCGGHIIGASYSALAAKNGKLRPENQLPEQLKLYEGKITCETCHGSEPHDGPPLVIDNQGSSLCRACHL